MKPKNPLVKKIPDLEGIPPGTMINIGGSTGTFLDIITEGGNRVVVSDHTTESLFGGMNVERRYYDSDADGRVGPGYSGEYIKGTMRTLLNLNETLALG